MNNYRPIIVIVIVITLLALQYGCHKRTEKKSPSFRYGVTLYK